MNGYEPSTPVMTQPLVLEESTLKNADFEQIYLGHRRRATNQQQTFKLSASSLLNQFRSTPHHRSPSHGDWALSGSSGDFELELRSDIDDLGITWRISGDFYSISGVAVIYYASFIVTAPAFAITPTQAIAEGRGTFTWSVVDRHEHGFDIPEENVQMACREVHRQAGGSAAHQSVWICEPY